MARAYTLDVSQAKAGDSGIGGNQIQEGGKYLGTIQEAKAVISSQKKTEGIEFKVETAEGQKAQYITIWTYNAEGKPLAGAAQVHALMMCLKTRALSTAMAMGKEYDVEAREERDVKIEIYPELMKKPIGFVLQKELSTKADGSDKTSFSFYGFFNAESGQTATEMADKEPPTAIDNMLRTLHDVDNRRPNYPAASQGQPSGQASAGGAPKASQDFDDDIPW